MHILINIFDLFLGSKIIGTGNYLKYINAFFLVANSKETLLGMRKRNKNRKEISLDNQDAHLHSCLL